MNETLRQDWDSFWSRDHKQALFVSDFNLVSHQGEITLKLLKGRIKGEKILEAGCGIGNWVSLFDKLGFKVYGLDISFASLKRAYGFNKNNRLKADFLQTDIKKIPFKNNSFDIIVSYGAIEHFPDTQKALDEFFRVLKPGGICLVTTPNPFSFHRLIGRHLLNLTKSKKLGYVGYEDAYTPGELSDMLKEAGFCRTDFGVLKNGMGYLFGDFWPAIPVIGNFIFKALLRLASFIESRQKTVGGGSFAIGYK